MDNKTTELFTQVRIAHRLLAAYYQRIHHLIEEVTNDEELNLEFFSWGPAEFDPPPRRDTNILNKYSWDLLPGVVTNYLFLHGDKKIQRPGDWLLGFHVISDTALEGEENPLEISISPEDSHSVLRCYIYAIYEDSNYDWYHEIWNVIDYPEYTDEPTLQCIDEESQIYACGFEIPLEELTLKGSTQRVVDMVKAYKEVALSSLQKE